jgi:hypothetical protein
MTDPDGEEYVLWFVCRRKSDLEEVKNWRRGGGTTERRPLDQVTVRDVTIKSVGGVERFDAVLGEDGMWKAVPVEAGAPTPAPSTSAPPAPPPAP